MTKQSNNEGTEQVTELSDLSQIRNSIEKLDRRILEALKERMGLAVRVADVKLQSAVAIRDQQREDQLLKHIRTEAAELGLDAHRFEQLYRLIIEASVAQQQTHLENLPDTPLRVAYQGVEGSYSHLTAQRRYAGRDGGVLLSGFDDFRSAAESVLNGTNDVALLPIENSTAGSINATYDILSDGGLVINAEEVTEIKHQLLGLPGADLDSIERVLSHPQALAQCERFLRALTNVEIVPFSDTAGAAQEVRLAHDPKAAAIASAAAATVFGLQVLAPDIQNQASNYTRFVELAPEAANCPADSQCKTSLLLATGHAPGDLADVLSHFARRNLNLTKLESRPRPDKPWSYRFYLDVEGHAASAVFSQALDAIRPHTRELRVLGTYPISQFYRELAAASAARSKMTTEQAED